MGKVLVISLSVLFGVGIVMMIGFLSDTWHTVDFAEYGLDYDKFAKNVGSHVYEPGRYATGIGHTFLVFPRTLKTIEFSGGDSLRSRTKDGLSLSLEISFQYQIEKDNLWDMFNMLGMDYEPVFVKMSRDVLRDVAARYNATSFFDDRGDIASTMLESITNRLKDVKCTVRFLQLRQVDLPDAYETILQDKEIVKQEIQKAMQEQIAEQVRANTQVLVAGYSAQQIVIAASAQAESVVLGATAQANSTSIKVAAEANAFASLSNKLSFNSTELLAYLWVQAVRDHDSSNLVVNLDKPAILNLPGN